MATYIKIASSTVGAGGVASVTFSSIPATYTDLILKFSSRVTFSGYYENIGIQFNSSGGTAYTDKLVYGNGSSAASAGNTSAARFLFQYGVAATSTANTFGNTEIYIPNYRTSNYKSVSIDSVTENNNTSNSIAALSCALWSDTSAINSITLTPLTSNFVQYSTFTLYGVSNA